MVAKTRCEGLEMAAATVEKKITFDTDIKQKAIDYTLQYSNRAAA